MYANLTKPIENILDYALEVKFIIEESLHPSRVIHSEKIN